MTKIAKYSVKIKFSAFSQNNSSVFVGYHCKAETKFILKIATTQRKVYLVR